MEWQSLSQARVREASGYNPVLWDGAKQLLVFQGLMAKFSQNPDLKAKLLETGDAFLVECAVKDRIWACGISLHDEARRDLHTWKGQNLLGFALMEVRRALAEKDDER